MSKRYISVELGTRLNRTMDNNMVVVCAEGPRFEGDFGCHIAIDFRQKTGPHPGTLYYCTRLI